MKITPLEIRQKSFEKHFRGFDKDEVNGFLQTLSQEWERIQDENRELRIKLEGTEKEVLKLREVEGSLYKTLKTAEDTGVNVIEQARQAANLHLRESQLKAEGMLNEAKMKAKDSMEEAELRARQVLVEMEDKLKAMVENYKKLESTRDDLLSELKRISQDTQERVDRIKNAHREFDADNHLSQARIDIKRVVFPNQNSNHTPKTEVKIPLPEPAAEELQEVVLENTLSAQAHTNDRRIKSFFDEIG